MQVRIISKITTIVKLGEGVSYEEAKAEIFGRISENAELQEQCEDIQAGHTSAVVFDTPIASEVTHSFEEVK